MESIRDSVAERTEAYPVYAAHTGSSRKRNEASRRCPKPGSN